MDPGVSTNEIELETAVLAEHSPAIRNVVGMEMLTSIKLKEVAFATFIAKVVSVPLFGWRAIVESRY